MSQSFSRGLTSAGPGAGRGEAVPSLAAGLVASLAGWMIGDALQPYLGTGVTLVLSLVASTLIYFYARRWLRELRGR
jgi:hypothetical protein